MTVRSSDPSRRRSRTVVGDEHGAVLAFVVLALIVILACAGLAIDLGRGYITKIRLARAVDAAALAGARGFRVNKARQEARAVFRANIPADPDDPSDTVDPVVTPGTNDRGEDTLTVSAVQALPTTFMKVVGITVMNVRAEAVAAVPPLDLALVVDISVSLEDAGVFGQVQSATRTFINHFHDQIDKMALVGFQSAAVVAEPMRHNFKGPMNSLIRDVFRAGGNTHMQEGLRMAREQVTDPALTRPNAAKVVIFFTDGKPTSVRDFFDCGGGSQDRTLVAWDVELPTAKFGGRYDRDDIYNYTVWDFPWGSMPSFDACAGAGYGECCGYTADDVRDMAEEQTQVEAGRIRRGERVPGVPGEEKVLIYVIGLGDVQIEYLCQLANTRTTNTPGGECNDVPLVGDEPQGKMYYAPTANQLRDVFEEVARDLIVRLAE